MPIERSNKSLTSDDLLAKARASALAAIPSSNAAWTLRRAAGFAAVLAIGAGAIYVVGNRSDAPAASSSSTTQAKSVLPSASNAPATTVPSAPIEVAPTPPTTLVASLAPVSNPEPAAAPTTAAPTTAAAVPTTTNALPATTIQEPPSTLGTTVAPAPAPAPAPATVPALLDGVLTAEELPANYSVFANGTMYNFGTVASAEAAQSVTSKFEAVVPVEDNFVVAEGGPTPTGIVYVPSGVLFALGSAKVGVEFQPTLDLATAFMSFFPQVRMTIVGHTDSSGDDAANMALSIQRAETAVRYMISKGIEPSRIAAEGRGESDPVATNDTPEGQTTNRRIEFVLNGLLDA